MKEKEDGKLENQFSGSWNTALYAYENGVITDEELANFKSVNKKGNRVKHRIWKDRQPDSAMSSRISSIIDAKEPLPHDDPVIRMVRHHQELVRSLEENNIVAGMSNEQKKQVLNNFTRTIMFSWKEKQFLSDKKAEELIEIKGQRQRSKARPDHDV